MRWSRHQDHTPLGELLEEQPEEAASTTDDDTVVREVEPGPTDADPTDPAPTDPAETEPTDSFLDDEDYLPQERSGPGRLTVALVAALVLAVGVLGGVWVQKQLGTTASAAGFGAGQGFPGAGAGTGTGQRGTGGTGAGGTAPGGTAPGGTATGGKGAGTGAGTGQGGAPGGDASPGGGADTSGGAAGTSTSGSGTAAAPAVVGTVTTAGKKSLLVTDLGGTEHTVTLTDATTVTTSYSHGALKAGDTVAVVGDAGTDGSVSATAITVT